ncbi:hypothetical protein [Fluviicola taffensis]|uniref:Uncharacterized protein n=1 Tax=Fluviicola taffensis (strain DSM 16823 / NCIMB 13979 / RW262) TaxID=755732 RepID=F2IHC6_FLUTR|nr:hypothetical protein [Fluviicola taffensis]AEA42681.1 hypothetical protein Fluta_0677 [Fluviicola taffensis DSM 16823]
MNEEKLIEIIKVQNQLLNILIKEYNKNKFLTPEEREKVNGLQKSLESLNKEIPQ